MEYVLQGFKSGFDIAYQGPRVGRVSPNSPTLRGLESIVQEKIDKEVKMGRYVGPFASPPLPNLICSPLALVPKGADDFRLINNLKLPIGTSVNSFIHPADATTVYQPFDHAVRLVLDQGQGAWMSRCDLKSAFRQVPLRVQDFALFGVAFQRKFYVDRNMCFGLRTSCRIFEEIAHALQWILESRTQVPAAHYLDDFLQVHIVRSISLSLVYTFYDICKEVNLPVAEDKTLWPSQVMSYLGNEIDTILMIIRVPPDKIAETRILIAAILASKTVTVKKIASVAGLLNFFTRAVLPGRAFLSRLYAVTHLPQHHHVNITTGIRGDLKMWLHLLTVHPLWTPMCRYYPITAQHFNLYTDAAGGRGTGFGITFQNQWTFGVWPEWVHEQQAAELIDIAFLELYAVLVALHLYWYPLSNKKIVLNCDNTVALHAINEKTAACPLMMILVRRMVVFCALKNIEVVGVYVQSKKNRFADLLSRNHPNQFLQEAPITTLRVPTPLPTFLWPLSEEKLMNLDF